MKLNQETQEILYFLQKMLESHMKDCYAELKNSGFYDVDDFDAPSTAEQDMILVKQEIYEDLLIEILHMQGKRYFMEFIAEEIAKDMARKDRPDTFERKVNLTYLTAVPRFKLQS
ncbi:MAG: hypothetical protein IKM19_06800 [Firmicutes bacterium]|nr:hypothetical protein [Bacillota bacterium]